MAEHEFAPLSQACVRALTDKQYDKRKLAASEIEKMTKVFQSSKNSSQIKKLLIVLGNDFTISQNPNFRKGGLIGLASAAVALGKDANEFVNYLIPPILTNFMDSDAKIRYFACESLYNVVKVTRGAVLPYFNDIFSGLSRLACDLDQGVKNGSEHLDRLMKDIVTESATFDLVPFIPLLRDRLYSNESFSRQFIISWIAVLYAVPDINLITYLPEILDGLFHILDDPSPEIQKICGTVLSEFLRNITKDPSQVNFKSMINILTAHAQAYNDTLKLTAITWIKTFVNLSKQDMLPYTSGILIAILPCFSYEGESKKSIKECAKIVNKDIMNLIKEQSKNEGELSEEVLSIESILSVLSTEVSYISVPTKVAALNWYYHLHSSIPNQLAPHLEFVFPILLSVLKDPSDEVVQQALFVISQIVSPDNKVSYFSEFISRLLKIFVLNSQLLETRGPFIIRQLCTLLNPEDIYQMMAKLLINENYKFIRVMVDNLNTILLTSPELFDLRTRLKDEESNELFKVLYYTWCHNPVALISLCLLTRNYEHTCSLIEILADFENTVEFLIEVDKLVQLLESPIFIKLRVQLLEVPQNLYLVRAMYGILMLLPQTEAFHTLRRRLECVPKVELDQNIVVAYKNRYDLNFEDLKKTFVEVQTVHKENKATDRREVMSKSIKDMMF